MADWIDEFLVKPMQAPAEYAPYNLVNTVVYAVVALAAVYLIYKYLEGKGVAVDKRFFRLVLPFVVLGSSVRVLADAGFLPRSVELWGATLYPFITPGIYLLTAGFLVVAVAVGKAAGKTFHYAERIGWVAALLAVLFLLPLLKHLAHFFAILFLAFLALKAFEWLWAKRRLKTGFMEKAAVFSQSLDGAASFVGVGFGTPTASYFEQHVVSGAVMQLGTPLAFFVLKALFVLAVVEILRRELREKREENQKNFILLLIIILGLAPGLRDLLRIACGV